MKYHLNIDGNRITTHPVTLEEAVRRWGPVQELEKQGYRLIPNGGIK